MASALQRKDALVFSHMGFYVRDLDRMAAFYRDPTVSTAPSL